jgi:glycosyltransferase involved in cell wall biosynthesis
MKHPMAPRISVIIPVYNGERYVAAAIDSVRAQTCDGWELVVVDDGSTDGTAAVLAAYGSDPRIQLSRQENLGLSAARNRGLSLSHAAQIAFLDADDVWQPAYLERMAAALQSRRDSALAFAGWQYIDGDGVVLPQSVVVPPSQVEQLREDLDRRNPLISSGVVVWRRCVDASGGFDPALLNCEDWDLWLRMKPLGSFVAVPEVLVWYRTHGENMSDNIERMERARCKVLDKHLGSEADVSADRAQRRREVLGYLLFLSALGYFCTRNIAAGQTKLRSAVELWPGLLEQDEVYYELGCAFQKRGYRGTPIGLDIRESTALVRRLLTQWLPLPASISRAAWGRACLALAQLALIAGERGAARQSALRAIIRCSGVHRRKAARGLLRASLPQRWVQVFRGASARCIAPAGRDG